MYRLSHVHSPIPLDDTLPALMMNAALLQKSQVKHHQVPHFRTGAFTVLQINCCYASHHAERSLHCLLHAYFIFYCSSIWSYSFMDNYCQKHFFCHELHFKRRRYFTYPPWLATSCNYKPGLTTCSPGHVLVLSESI